MVPNNHTAKVCTNWMSDYGQYCLAFCDKSFTMMNDDSYDQWYVCGASGRWIPSSTLSKCESKLPLRYYLKWNLFLEYWLLRFIERTTNSIISENILKISQVSTESVNHMTYNTMAKRKRTNNDIQSTTQRTRATLKQQWSTKHYTENTSHAKTTMIYKVLRREHEPH